MKKFLYLTMALPLLAATSCSNDDLPAPGQDDGMTTFTVKMPGEIPSRVFADGTTAKNLAVAVYDENDNLLYSNIAGQGEALPEGASVGDFSAGLTTTVTLPLVKDKEYNVAFWAYAENSPYTFSPGDKKITVNYTGALANDDTRDGFFNYYNVPAQRPATKNVELRRPFAQINIGTSDLEAARKAGVAVTSANISFPAGALATAYNFVEGTADTPNTAAVTFTGSALPADAFPVQPETYKYLVMAYVLTPVDQTSQPKTVMQSVSLAVNGNAFASYDNIPAQANYQTNIYGALLTNKENFNVTIQPAFLTPSLSVAEWDGMTVTYPTVDEATKSVAIQTPSDLAGLAHMVSGTEGQTARDFAGYTVKLNGDFDFKGFEFPMIAAGATRNNGDSEGVAFSGVLDGQGHTIKNLTISKPSAADDDAVGFIANLKGQGAALKNLNIENLNISTSAEQAGLVGLVSEGASVSGVNVKSGNLTGGKATGAIVGRVMKHGTISNCTNGANITSKTSNAGGIAGASYYTAEGKQTVITGCTNSGTIHAENVAAGGISGLNTGLIVNCTNTGNVTAVTNSAGGIVGVQQSAGYVRGCNNSGDVTCNGQLGAGGIIGWVKYDNTDSAYPVQNIIEVTGNTNSGTITGTGSSTYGVSGIVGLWYQAGVCDNNINLAPAINATGMCAGITVSQTIGTNPNKIPNYQLMLYVRNNVSTTPTEMTAQYVYTNTPGTVTESGNKATLD